MNASTGLFESYEASDFTQFEPGKGYIIVGLQASEFDYGKTETVTSFVYDSTGARVKKTVAGGTSTVYLGKDYDVTSSLSTKYIFLGDMRISTKKSDGTLEYIHSDHINSSNIITDSSGNQTGLLEYDPYGVTATHTGSADPKHKYTGQEEDASTNLYYYNARYYDPQLGRFVTPDWIVQAPEDPQTLNRYSYARNNPIVFIDPTGNFIEWIIIGAIVGGLAAGIQSGWNPTAMAMGALFGAIGGAVGGGVGSQFSNAFIGGIVGGATGGATVGGLNAAYYGGDIGQGILRGAGYGALGGAVFGGLNMGFDAVAKQPGFRWEYVRASQVIATGAAGGGLAELSGGEFWEGVAFSSAIAGSQFIFRVITAVGDGTPRNPTFETSDGSFAAKDANQALHPAGSKKSNMGNKFGPYELPRGKMQTLYFGEEAEVLRFISSRVPLSESISQLHEAFQNDVVRVCSNQATVDMLNVPTMFPSAAITLAGALNDRPALIGTFGLYDDEK